MTTKQLIRIHTAAGAERGSLQVKRTHGGGGTFHHSTIDI